MDLKQPQNSDKYQSYYHFRLLLAVLDIQ